MGCRLCSVLGWSGSDLLSQVLRHSTIGAALLNGRVRDGIGFYQRAKATRPAKHRFGQRRGFQDGIPVECVLIICCKLVFFPFSSSPAAQVADIGNGSDQVDRGISTGKLNVSPRLHTRPINVVVFHASQGNTRFEVGFPLRCIQRLSRPNIATLHCGWRHNRSTRGLFIPVLSY